MDRDELIRRINEIEPDDYSNWTIEELQELAIFLEIL